MLATHHVSPAWVSAFLQPDVEQATTGILEPPQKFQNLSSRLTLVAICILLFVGPTDAIPDGTMYMKEVNKDPLNS